MVAKAARRAQGKKLAGKRRQPESDEPKRGKKVKSDSKPAKRKVDGGQQPPAKKQKTKPISQKKLKAAAASGCDTLQPKH